MDKKLQSLVILKLRNTNFTNKKIVSNKVPFGKKGFKCFICYKDVKKVKLLCIMLPKMSACRKDSDETK